MGRIITFIFILLQGFQLLGQPILALDTVVSGLTQPIHVTNSGDSRIFVTERQGRIRIVQGGTLVPTPFLNISTKVNTSGEGGLSGLAFHPQFSSNRYFYVKYTRTGTGGNPLTTYISRFTRDAIFPDSANFNSELVIDTIHQPYSNHNGGDLHFGPDGMLYVMMGDGGSGDDPQNNSQNMRKRLGKVLRYNVDIASPFIPADNPYLLGGDTIPDAIWAAGLRNPFRFSFDRANGDLWIGDVGQGALEEIDYVPSGQGSTWNFGWRCFEGNMIHDTTNCGAYSSYNAPVRWYNHSYNNQTVDGGRSVTGGYVYRGSQYPFLDGYYIHADYLSNKVWGLKKVMQDSFLNTYFGQLITSPVGFGEDSSGEMYTVSINAGVLFKIKEVCQGQIPVVTQMGNQLLGSSAAPNGSTWQWYYQQDSIIGATGSTFTPTALGQYKVRLKSPQGCTVFSDSFIYVLPQTVFVSEYTEGSGSNQCLEIYNGTATTIDFTADNYSVDIFYDGSAVAGVNVPILGTLASGAAFVVCNPAADAQFLAQADQTSTNINFTGNDAFQLKKGAQVLDVFGQIGFNPGTGWPGSCGVQSTADHTLIRRGTVLTGDTNGGNLFDATAEWICFPQNYSADLGFHPVEALPIKLEYVRAERKIGSIDMEWKISLGSTPAYFEIERSVDLVSFQRLAKINPVGSEETDGLYRYADVTAPNSRVYYRLKMVDQDLSFLYSQVVSVASIQGGFVVNGVYPIPVKDEITIDIDVFENSKLNFECFDLTGRMMFSREKTFSPGLAQFKESVKDFPAGAYWLRLSTDTQAIVRQVIVE
ncbi:MAG: PQQ-dependent sugar dehydrogenase [Saprospiraceae bacterium]